MPHLLRLSENAGVLILDYPIWIGAIATVLGVLLSAYLLRNDPWSMKKLAGPWIAAALMLYAGIFFMTFRARLDAAGGQSGSIVTQRQRVDWRDADVASLTEAAGQRHTNVSIFVRLKSGGAFEINVTDLAPEGRDRVHSWVKARIPQ